MFASSSCKPFCILVVYILIAQLSGVYIVAYWAKDIMIVSFGLNNLTV